MSLMSNSKRKSLEKTRLFQDNDNPRLLIINNLWYSKFKNNIWYSNSTFFFLFFFLWGAPENWLKGPKSCCVLG